MHRRIGRTLTAAVVMAAIQLPAAQAFAAKRQPGAGDPLASSQLNAAISVNQANGRSVYHLAFEVARSTGVDVALTNVAVALSQCLDCRTIAVAIQVDLVSPVPTILAATNLAVAANTQCTLCDSLAFAFQYVVATTTPVTFTTQGTQRGAEDRAARCPVLNQRLAGKPAAAIAKVVALNDELSSVLQTQLVAVPADQDAPEGW